MHVVLRVHERSLTAVRSAHDSGEGCRRLTWFAGMQSAVESLHTIATHLPGLLDGGSDSPAHPASARSLRPLTPDQVRRRTLLVS